MTALTLENLTLSYQRHPVVHHVTGAFRSGSSTAIVGPNGAGKSTLLKAIVGLLTPDHGHVRFEGVARRQLAYLPQQANIERQFPISVLDTILLGAAHAGSRWQRWFGGSSKAERERALAALDQVGLTGFEERPVGALSSGQFQRVLFARILLQDAPLILLDEPFTAIDARTTHDLLRIVAHWQAEGRTVIAVLHDFEQVHRHFDQTLLLAKECIGWGPSAEVLTRDNLLRANGMAERWVADAAVCHRDDEEVAA
ncbi:zinc/manganese transport system ATP-binding protein [Andreprevotia lacus DSM 23236]|jgi:zinc/manganese transport system ATP-binding protein|uniref:Zinc/manganese transport system ATP-binding protein n=1 Tax=Andreprevotia lacus DSM 23236 TaxID=1121001 RepID=A0A1W1Y0E4_9NEIS|nr:ABC transporter ATP-binding protein [Andreprevotia lacus]SMC29633.1 zinc/manganese transport system ATP-binding protein [Andreprevotia lacus DSM 23236]